MTCERQPQRPRREVPYFYRAVPGPGGEPRVVRLDGDGANPAEVAGEDAIQAPGGRPFGFGFLNGVATDEAGGGGLRRMGVGLGGFDQGLGVGRRAVGS